MPSAWWASTLSNDGAEAVDICGVAQSFKITLPVKRVPMGDEHEYSTRSMGRYLKGFAGRHFITDDGTEVELCQSEKRGNGGYPWMLKEVKAKPKSASANKVVTPFKVKVPPKQKSPTGPNALTKAAKKAANQTNAPKNPFKN